MRKNKYFQELSGLPDHQPLMLAMYSQARRALKRERVSQGYVLDLGRLVGRFSDVFDAPPMQIWRKQDKLVRSLAQSHCRGYGEPKRTEASDKLGGGESHRCDTRPDLRRWAFVGVVAIECLDAAFKAS